MCLGSSRTEIARRARKTVVGLNLLGTLARGGIDLGALNGPVAPGDLGDDLIDDLVLNEEDVSHLAIVTVGPNVGAGLGVDELRRDTKAVVGALDAALEHVAHLQLAAELPDVLGLVLILEGGVAREHAQVARPDSSVKMSSVKPYAEIFLFRVATQIVEGEDRDRPGLWAHRAPSPRLHFRALSVAKGRG